MTPEVALTPECMADLEVALLGWAAALVALAGAGRDAQHDDEVQAVSLSCVAAEGEDDDMGNWLCSPAWTARGPSRVRHTGIPGPRGAVNDPR